MFPRVVVAVALLLGCGHEPPPMSPPPPAAPLPPPKSLDEACARWKCRPAGRVELSTPKGRLVVTEGRTVYSDGEVARILAGETFAITGDVQGDRLVNLRLADDKADKDVLLLKFEQRPLKKEPAMVLTVTNRFGRNLKYRASMETPERKGFYKTSSCPVRPGASSFEMWPHPIISLMLREIHFIEAGGQMTCN